MRIKIIKLRVKEENGGRDDCPDSKLEVRPGRRTSELQNLRGERRS